jgi:hypothetical protein
MLSGLTETQIRELNRSGPAERHAKLGTRIGAMESLILEKPGNIYYVNTVSGSNDSDGLTWDNAFLTMAKAFTVIGSRDTIYFVGKVREQIIAPLGVYGVTIIGADTAPRHDLAASWMAPATGATASKALCEIIEQGWRFVNILFVSTTTAPAIQMTRNEDAVHPDPSHAQFIGCRFFGVDGITDTGGCFGVKIIDCQFYALTGTALKQNGVSMDWPTAWKVIGCEFVSCAAAIVKPLKWSTVRDNVFNTNTITIDLTGGTAPNYVYDNHFNLAAADFDPTGGVTGVTGDYWSNMLLDILEIGLPAD